MSSFSMIRPRVVLLLLGVLVLGSSAASGQPLYESSWKPMTRAERLERAKEYLAVVRDLETSLPTLSPSQQEWLRAEKAAIYDEDGSWKAEMHKRQWALEQTKEKALDVVNRRVRTLAVALTDITSAGPPLRREITRWGVVMSSLLDNELWFDMRRLVDFQILDERLIRELTHHENAGSVESSRRLAKIDAVTLLGRIINPYLDGRLPDQAKQPR